jgi:hypothetical protein
MSLFSERRERRQKVDKAIEEIAQAKDVADAREPHVNALWEWLTSRRMTNGIGVDFEYTLARPRRSGG